MVASLIICCHEKGFHFQLCGMDSYLLKNRSYNELHSYFYPYYFVVFFSTKQEKISNYKVFFHLNKCYFISQDETFLLSSRVKQSHTITPIQYYMQSQSTSPEDGTPSEPMCCFSLLFSFPCSRFTKMKAPIGPRFH